MQTKRHKASVLIISMIVLSMILVTALTISLSTLRSRKTSVGSSKSGIAYQNAETGVEKVMDKIVNGGYVTVGEFCTGSGSILQGANYTAELKKADGTEINCSGSFNSVKISEIATIKSIGQDPGDQAKRAIEAAVAATGLNWLPLTFVNGWTDYGTFQVAQYAKDNRTGMVYLRGLIKNPSASPSGGDPNHYGMATLPEGYRPVTGRIIFNQSGADTIHGGAYAGWTSWRVDVTPVGEIKVLFLTNGSTADKYLPTSYLSLDGISFAAN